MDEHSGIVPSIIVKTKKEILANRFILVIFPVSQSSTSLSTQSVTDFNAHHRSPQTISHIDAPSTKRICAEEEKNTRILIGPLIDKTKN